MTLFTISVVLYHVSFFGRRPCRAFEGALEGSVMVDRL